MQQDKFKEMVKKCANNISEKIYKNKKKLIIVHFVEGPKDDPYEIRRSEIILNNTLFNDIYRKYYKNNVLKEIAFHNKILKDYIQYYARHNTYLRLVVNNYAQSFKRNPHRIRMLFHFKSSDNIGNKVFDTINKSDSGWTWLINRNNLNELIPQNFSDKFWKYFYNENISEDPYLPSALSWMESIEFLRALTLYKHLQIKKGIEPVKILDNELDHNLMGIHKKYKDDYICITAFQSMSIFMRGLKCNNNELGTTAIIQKVNPQKANNLALVVVMVSPIDESETIQRVYDAIIEEFNDYNDYTNRAKREKIGIMFNKIIDEIDSEYIDKKNELFESAVISLFKSPIQQSNSKIYCKWILLLINKLIGKVHEGNKLDFYFICGDKSQFEDDRNIEFRNLDDVEANILSIPCNENNIPSKKNIFNVLNIASSWLSKEHFPWFAEGRYALLWDVSSKERKPCGLVRIKRSNWQNLLNDRFKGCSKTDIPKCVIGCVTVNPQTASIVLVKKKNKDSEYETMESIEIEEKYRWEDNKLINLSNDNRIKGLNRTLFANIRRVYRLNKHDNKIDEMKKYIKWIADDPNRGSIIVFINKQKTKKAKIISSKNPFKTMGKPWNVSERTGKAALEDKIALMSHDGATVVSYSDKKFKYNYRQLLTSDKIKKIVKVELEDLATNNKLEDAGKIVMEGVFPLSCVGTRRWSAAFAAFAEEVLGIIVISQDGDIQYWQTSLKRGKNGNGGLNDYNIQILYFSNTKDCIKYQYKNGKFIETKLRR